MFKSRAGVVRSDHVDSTSEDEEYVPDAETQFQLDTNAHIAKLNMLEARLQTQVADLTRDMMRANDDGNAAKAVKLWSVLEKTQARLDDVGLKKVDARTAKLDLEYQAASTTELALQQSQMRAMRAIGQSGGVGSIDDARRSQIEIRQQRAEHAAVHDEMQRLKDEDAAAESEAKAATAAAAAGGAGASGSTMPAAMVEFLKNKQLKDELNRPAAGTSGRGQVSSIGLRIKEMQKQRRDAQKE